MKKKLGNKGFSLVELIIVIAIMAILVGVLAPVLIRQLEKAKISSDLEILSSMCAAIEYGLVELGTGVVPDDPSKDLADLINNSTTPIPLTVLEDAQYQGSLVEYIKETSGINSFTAASMDKLLKARRDASGGIYFNRRGSAINPIIMWITGSDREGKGRTPAAPSDYTGVTCEIAID